MDQEMKDALAWYGRELRANGRQAAEPLIAAGELRFTDFRRWATALAILLRAEEFLDGHVAKW